MTGASNQAKQHNKIVTTPTPLQYYSSKFNSRALINYTVEAEADGSFLWWNNNNKHFLTKDGKKEAPWSRL